MHKTDFRSTGKSLATWLECLPGVRRRSPCVPLLPWLY
jgi:hypothetical protein